MQKCAVPFFVRAYWCACVGAPMFPRATAAMLPVPHATRPARSHTFPTPSAPRPHPPRALARVPHALPAYMHRCGKLA